MLQYPVPLWDFRVPGVTSISADVHKYGYAAKGASTISWISQEYRQFQFFAFAQWPGGHYTTTHSNSHSNSKGDCTKEHPKCAILSTQIAHEFARRMFSSL